MKSFLNAVAIAALSSQHVVGFTTHHRTVIKILHGQPTKSQLWNSVDDETESLRRKAAQLRDEVSEFENSKKDILKKEKKERSEVLKKKEEIRMRYSAEVPILKSDGNVEKEKQQSLTPKNRFYLAAHRRAKRQKKRQSFQRKRQRWSTSESQL